MTLEELAAKSGLSRVSVNRYELGTRTPRADAALKLAKALNCTVEELLKEDSDKGDGNDGG